MSKNLVIVESPAKAKTLGQFLGSDYTVKASLGHVRDLPEKEIGIDVENDFAPTYVVVKGKTKVLKEIKDAAKTAKAVYLATDPDREGEAISWHLIEAAGLGKKQLKRVVFHEITKEAILDAFKHPRTIDLKLVNAQQARRILDRLVGYKLSPLLWKKVRRGLSAGRVQSVAVKLIVDREAEILAFVPVEYWSIEAELSQEGKKSSFRANLVGPVNGDKIELKDKEQTDKLVAKLEKASYAASGVRQKQTSRQPAPPFITSTLQQEAWRKFRFSGKQTMAIAQQLYEGLPLGEAGQVGLITYMRTDSTNVSASALAEARDYIAEKYGKEYLPPTARRFAKKVKGAQEAHEAIRPTSVRREPNALHQYLNTEQIKLYTLIWQRMVSSQMAAAQVDTTTVDIEATTAAKEKYLFRASNSVVSFPGFLTLYQESKDEDENGEKKNKLPQLSKGEKLRLVQLEPDQHFTQAPPRYTEATLIKALEEKGIGRPSTYAPILSLIQERGYVERASGRLAPTELGTIVSKTLSEHFADIVNVDFTAQMEEKLDQVAAGELEWVPMLHEFYKPFQETLSKATKAIAKVSEPTNEVCEKCGRPMIIKWGRMGKFMSCSGWPECKNARSIVVTISEPTGEICEKCGRPMVIKWGRQGKFISCSGFPECKNARSIVVTTGVKCPECGSDLLERKSKRGRTFYGCSGYPKCKFALWDKPLPKPCPECGALMTLSKKGVAKCTKCSYEGAEE